MIKKLIIIGVVLLIGFSLWFMLTNHSNSEPTEIYLISESRFILNDQAETLKLHYFTNKKDFKLFEKDDIIYLHNDSEALKFFIDLIEIKSFHNEMLFDQLFYGYEVILSLPMIEDSYYLENCFISWNNRFETKRIFIGELYVEYVKDIINFPFQGLEGIKGDFPKLSQIIVNVNDSVEIYEVKIGSYDINYFASDGLLVLNIPEMTYLFYDTYVKIITNEGDTYLPQFVYFKNYELLSFSLYQRYVF